MYSKSTLFFQPDGLSFAQAFADSDASVGLVLGSLAAVVFTVVFYMCRRVIGFQDCMSGFTEGFRLMVPALMILCCAWTLKNMTDSIGAKVFISDLINMAIIAVSACMAGAVCGDHCSPISDTTIVSSAGAQCNHVVHVRTQLPYALVVAAVSFVMYLIVPFVVSPWICIPLGAVLLVAVLSGMKIILDKRR